MQARHANGCGGRIKGVSERRDAQGLTAVDAAEDEVVELRVLGVLRQFGAKKAVESALAGLLGARRAHAIPLPWTGVADSAMVAVGGTGRGVAPVGATISPKRTPVWARKRATSRHVSLVRCPGY